MPAPDTMKFIPLGGVDEIGKNIYVYEYGEDIIVVDCGSRFPGDDMMGIDLLIPDARYLIENKHRIRGWLFTHGHEDHIGATPYILPLAPAPVFASRLTIALIDSKLQEHGVRGIPLQVVEPRQEISLGAFRVRFIKVNHSTAGAFSLAIGCPAGLVVHSGDFKIDYTPVGDDVADLNMLAALGEEGVLTLVCESTNVEEKGYTMSEREVCETFVDQFRKAKGRVIVAMFASNIKRMQQVIDNAVSFGRKVCFVGRSMINVSRVAMEIGELKVRPENLLDMDELDRYPDQNILVLTTGAQGEPMSGLSRMAFAEHRKLQIKYTDKIIISADPIPGNRQSVSRVIDRLYRCGAEVVYEALARVHVSGHACQEEMKLYHTLTKSRYFIPIHGEYRMIFQHAELAETLGRKRADILLPNAGEVIQMGRGAFGVAGTVPSGTVMLDGLGYADVDGAVQQDRRRLAQEGVIILAIAYDRSSGVLVSGPDVISRGFVYIRENESMIESARDFVRDILASYPHIESSDWPEIKKRIKTELQQFIYEKIKRNPMILPIIVDLG